MTLPRRQQSSRLIEDSIPIRNVIETGNESDRIVGTILERKLRRVLDHQIDISPIDDVDPGPVAVTADQEVVPATDVEETALDMLHHF